MLEPTLLKGSGCAEPTQTCSQPRNPNLNKSISLAQQVRTICLQVSPWHQAAANRCGVTPAAWWQSPPSPVKATHCPHPMEGTRVGCRATLEVMEQGGSISSPLPLDRAADLDVHCPPCSVGKGIWTGPRLMWGCTRVVPTPTVRAGGGPSIPCRLSIPRTRIPPGSGSAGPALAPSEQPAMVEPSSSPSIILIRRRWQPGGPWQRGRTDSRPEPSPRDRQEHRGDKPSQTKTTTPLLGTSKRRAEIYVATEPAWVLGGCGQPRVGTWAGRGEGTALCLHGAVDATNGM